MQFMRIPTQLHFPHLGIPFGYPLPNGEVGTSKVETERQVETHWPALEIVVIDCLVMYTPLPNSVLLGNRSRSRGPDPTQESS